MIDPIVHLLSMGITPRQLAWSIAVGLVIGVNPLLGSTTLLALAVASTCRLNLIASQIGNHLVYPLELALFPVFIRLGIALFHTPPLPLEHHALFHAIKHHPWDTTRILWRWEWHALVVWALFAAIITPLISLALHPLLTRMLARKHATTSPQPKSS